MSLPPSAVSAALLVTCSCFAIGNAATAQPPQRTAAQWHKALHQGTLDDRRQAAIDTLTCDASLQQQLLPELINLLRHETDGQIRLAVFDTLTQMGPSAAAAVPALMLAMQRDFGGRHNEERHQDYRAALALSSIGEAAVEGLRNLLIEDAENLRAEAAMALGRIGPPASAAADDLVRLLSDSSARVRRDAIAALGAMGSTIVDPLLLAVRSDAASLRAAALSSLALASPEDHRVRTAVNDALVDSSTEVRAAAISALERVAPSEATFHDALMGGLQDEDESVRVAAVNLLAHRSEHLPEFEAQLARLLLDPGDGVAGHAAFLLGSRGPKALPRVVRAAKDPRSQLEQLAGAISMMRPVPLEELHRMLDDADARVKQMAALALGQIRPVAPQTVEKLAAGLSHGTTELRAAFLTAVTNLDSHAAAAIPAVRELSDHPDARIRRQVMEVLMRAAPHDEHLAADLTKRLNDTNFIVQQHAIDSLRSLGPRSRTAIPAVVDKLQSSNADVRVAAVLFLGSHGRAAAGAVTTLQRQLSGGEPPWRILVMETLGKMGAVAQPALTELQNQRRDESPEVRAAALKAIAKLDLDLERLRQPLLDGLADPAETVRDEASSAVRRLGDRAITLLPALIPLLVMEHAEEDVERLLDRLDRYEIDRETVEPLISLTEHSDVRVQKRAIEFLGLAGDAANGALSQLQSLIEHRDAAVRDAAQQAIAQIQGDPADSE